MVKNTITSNGAPMYLKEFEQLVDIMKRLRKECPWDREQTPESLRQYIIEEAYETIEAIDNQNWDELRKELGDLLLQIIFQAEIAQENNRFTLADVIRHINEKLIERHPHVFGDVKAETAGEVKDNWEQIKVKKENRQSILEGLPKIMSALLLAQRVQDKASQVGFDWEKPQDVVEKVKEEIEELQESIETNTPREVEEEIGDLLFSLVNLCRFYNVNGEDALRKTTNKFISRFQYIEKKLSEQNNSPREATLEEMDKLWEEAKLRSKKG
ncbi:MAG: nucleoside triphosphate pyrophosphohydrolase [Calditrichia bacterium]